MRFLCWFNLHHWRREDWSGRVCRRCGNRDVLVYTSERGAVWERVT